MMMEQVEYAQNYSYQNIIGALLDMSTHKRPDIAYAVGVSLRFCKTLNYRAWKANTRVLIYLRGTIDVKIRLSRRKLNLHAFSDAD